MSNFLFFLAKLYIVFPQLKRIKPIVISFYCLLRCLFSYFVQFSRCILSSLLKAHFDSTFSCLLSTNQPSHEVSYPLFLMLHSTSNPAGDRIGYRAVSFSSSENRFGPRGLCANPLTSAAILCILVEMNRLRTVDPLACKAGALVN